jgi:thioester reductase-like protein
MSQTFTRLSKSYLQLGRIDAANYFPKNVFVREPNHSDIDIEELNVKVD